MSPQQPISLRGVRVHNLKSIDLDLPQHKLIVCCGLSGSGKTSLALDALYAEGQRRYIESFSAYTRQFLQRLEKPDADHIENIPPAIAVTTSAGNRSSRATVATATETADYLRLLIAKIGHVSCMFCDRPVLRDSAQSIAELLSNLPDSIRYMIAFPLPITERTDTTAMTAALCEDGFVRVVVEDRTVTLDEMPLPPLDAAALENKVALGTRSCGSGSRHTSRFGTVTAGERLSDGNEDDEEDPDIWEPTEAEDDEDDSESLEVRRLDLVVVDRLKGDVETGRIRDSLETALSEGHGQCHVLLEATDETPFSRRGQLREIDGRRWRDIPFTTDLSCPDCGHDYPTPEPRLFSFNSPLGACRTCEGFGNVIDMDMELIVPDPLKTLRGGAVAPWNTPTHTPMLEKLIEVAPEFDIPLDVPFRELDPQHVAFVIHGSHDSRFEGLQGFFAALERRKYKMHVRVFLNRWRSPRPCPQCNGQRLRPEALAVRVGEKNIAEISAMEVRDALLFFETLDLSDEQRAVSKLMLDQIRGRLSYLDRVGLGYLTLDRPLRTLGGGERRRVALATALGSNLVNMLYVLDEPSIGLHPHDIDRLIGAVVDLRDRGNTVVVVEHEEAFIRRADQVVELGPGAGDQGGQIVFQGTPEQMEADEDSLTGDYLARRRGAGPPSRRRNTGHGWIRLVGANGNNLKDLTLEIPLGVLCVVSGVSGAGKSTLVSGTLYPALCRRLRKDAPKPYPLGDILGDGQIDEVVLVDQSPIGRSPRSNPVTYLKAFDEIRAVFADTPEAKSRGYGAGHFSFNVDGGRCPACKGDGAVRIDMQFLADVYMKCTECGGTRYRPEVLDVTYRGRNIADVLDMTVREAFTFFRGRTKVQARLKRLIDVGLDYIRLGQPANTLSGGEAQRLKLAGYMSAGRRGRCMFILDEPSTGLHFSDVVQLLDCFDMLISVGHSLVVIEHNLQVIQAADYVIDLGPGAADDGGYVVAEGTPEHVANSPKSITGRFLREELERAEPEGEPEGE